MRKFQKRNYLTQTGVADEETIALLYWLSDTKAPAESTALPEAGRATLRKINSDVESAVID